jgi:endoglucanase
VFTGDEFADGGEFIAEVLESKNIKASFFLTGNFYRRSAFTRIANRLKNDGHYMGAHSDKHLLYADWTKRDSLLVTERQFKKDLRKNYSRMKKFKIDKSDAAYFLPPFEWYNRSIAEWTRDLNLTLINFSPGTRSAADYTYPGMPAYRSSEEIYESIINYEQQDRSGLNGFILLVHIGTDKRRTDKFYWKLDSLIDELKGKGYSFVRIDQLLE